MAAHQLPVAPQVGQGCDHLLLCAGICSGLSWKWSCVCCYNHRELIRQTACYPGNTISYGHPPPLALRIFVLSLPNDS